MNALVIIDMQAAYFKDKNLLMQQHKLIESIQHHIASHVSKGDFIINVSTVHSRDKKTWTLNMLEDDQGFLFGDSAETSTLLDLPDNAIQVQKTRDSAFHETKLLSILEHNDINHITLAGVSAHTCIFHTAAAAYAYNIEVTLVEEAIGDENKQAMEFALNYLKVEYRQKVLSSKPYFHLLLGTI